MPLEINSGDKYSPYFWPWTKPCIPHRQLFQTHVNHNPWLRSANTTGAFETNGACFSKQEPLYVLAFPSGIYDPENGLDRGVSFSAP